LSEARNIKKQDKIKQQQQQIANIGSGLSNSSLMMSVKKKSKKVNKDSSSIFEMSNEKLFKQIVDKKKP
jgi:fibrillarin-like rRNA methylase